MIHIDNKYIGLLSSRLERLKRKSGNTYNCRCPICGDSQSNRSKTRGYIYEKKGHMLYFCHNCGASMSFGNFLKTIDGELHKEYTQEKFIEKYGSNSTFETPLITTAQPKFIKDSPLRHLKKISQLEYNHPAKLYVEKRKIPTNTHYKLFYAPKFKQWVNTFLPGKFDYEIDESRLILPFLDEDKNLFGLQGRSFTSTGIRYITIIIDSDKPKVFGLDTVDTTKRFYITEGPIDSLFIDNCIAMAGADINLSWVPAFNKANAVFVYDNEPRNADIVRRIQSTIDKGYRVFIWPSNILTKDINDYILNNHTKDEIKSLIDSNTFDGLAAQLAFTKWKKI